MKTGRKKVNKKRFEIKLHTKIELAEEWLDEFITDLSLIHEVLFLRLDKDGINVDDDWVIDAFDHKIARMMDLRDEIKELSKLAKKLENNKVLLEEGKE